MKFMITNKDKDNLVKILGKFIIDKNALIQLKLDGARSRVKWIAAEYFPNSFALNKCCVIEHDVVVYEYKEKQSKVYFQPDLLFRFLSKSKSESIIFEADINQISVQDDSSSLLLVLSNIDDTVFPDEETHVFNDIYIIDIDEFKDAIRSIIWSVGEANTFPNTDIILMEIDSSNEIMNVYGTSFATFARKKVPIKVDTANDNIDKIMLPISFGKDVLALFPSGEAKLLVNKKELMIKYDTQDEEFSLYFLYRQLEFRDNICKNIIKLRDKISTLEQKNIIIVDTETFLPLLKKVTLFSRSEVFANKPVYTLDIEQKDNSLFIKNSNTFGKTNTAYEVDVLKNDIDLSISINSLLLQNALYNIKGSAYLIHSGGNNPLVIMDSENPTYECCIALIRKEM